MRLLSFEMPTLTARVSVGIISPADVIVLHTGD